jgi:dTDP-4-dehydrorhamnose 3,5-epimerase
MIDGIEIKPLVSHFDSRGYFRELIRSTDPFFKEGFGQWSLSHIDTGVIKAWHIHQIQTDWWYVQNGQVKLACYDLRAQSKTYKQLNEFILGEESESQIIKIPPGIAHGCKVLKGPADLFYMTSHVYNPDDEGRIPENEASIGYDWSK